MERVTVFVNLLSNFSISSSLNFLKRFILSFNTWISFFHSSVDFASFIFSIKLSTISLLIPFKSYPTLIMNSNSLKGLKPNSFAKTWINTAALIYSFIAFFASNSLDHSILYTSDPTYIQGLWIPSASPAKIWIVLRSKILAPAAYAAIIFPVNWVWGPAAGPIGVPWGFGVTGTPKNDFDSWYSFKDWSNKSSNDIPFMSFFGFVALAILMQTNVILMTAKDK